MAKLFTQRKGQSAIEYLTTYGWMLLVIAIVGGAIFTTVQGSTDLQSSSGLTNTDIQIENFGITTESGDDDLEIELRNAAQEQVQSVDVAVTLNNGTQEWNNGTTIPVADTETLSFDNFSQDDTQDDYEVVINYDAGGLENQQISGTITGNFEYTG